LPENVKLQDTVTKPFNLLSEVCGEDKRVT